MNMPLAFRALIRPNPRSFPGARSLPTHEQMLNDTTYRISYIRSDVIIKVFDLDGTLLSHSDDPRETGFSPGVVAALKALLHDESVHIIFNTARPLDWVEDRMRRCGLDAERITVMAGAGRNQRYARIDAYQPQLVRISREKHPYLDEAQEILEKFFPEFVETYKELGKQQDRLSWLTQIEYTDEEYIHGELVVKQKERKSSSPKLKRLGDDSTHDFYPFVEQNGRGVNFSPGGDHQLCVSYEIKEGMLTINFSPRGSGDPQLLEATVDALKERLVELNIRVETNHEVITLDAMPDHVNKGTTVEYVVEKIMKETGSDTAMVEGYGDSYNDVSMMEIINGNWSKKALKNKTIIGVSHIVERFNDTFGAGPLNPPELRQWGHYSHPSPNALAQHLHTEAEHLGAIRRGCRQLMGRLNHSENRLLREQSTRHYPATTRTGLRTSMARNSCVKK